MARFVGQTASEVFAMKVSEYHKQGLKNWVDEKPEGYERLGQEARSGVHRVSFFARIADGKLADVRFNSSRRCRKLLALADLAAEKLRGQPADDYSLEPEELLNFFAEERNKETMRARVDLILQALKKVG